MEQIRITTPRLTLVPLGETYLETTAAYAMDAENTRYMCRMPMDTMEETGAFLARTGAEWQRECPAFYEFAVLNGGEHIGAVSLYPEDRGWELGWIINKRFWRQGFGYEAALALMRYAVDTLGIRRFVAYCDSDNIASRRIMEKLGMTCAAVTPGRRNRGAAGESEECRYEMVLPE